jgi:hypothetical protein
MALSADQRRYVVETALDLLRHRSSERVLELLAERLERGDYEDGEERDLDEIALAVARAIRDELGEPPP